MDENSGYFQVPIQKEDQEKTDFTMQRYSDTKYKRMKFVLANY